VLRYWEQEFTQLNPVKRKGNRRYYQREDLLTIRLIKSLLYDQGYTIEGARKQLIGEEVKENKSRYMQLINQTLSELDEILLILKA
jgi:DNA-binding transcriptional MerR regulator